MGLRAMTQEQFDKFSQQIRRLQGAYQKEVAPVGKTGILKNFEFYFGQKMGEDMQPFLEYAWPGFAGSPPLGLIFFDPALTDILAGFYQQLSESRSA